MNPMTHWIVLTDLDGTLLDHHNYRADAAKEALTQLARLNIPCIFNTSKTFSEVVSIRRQLNNTAPFVCENGGAVFIAKNNTDNHPLSLKHNHYNVEIFGTPHAVLLKFLRQARQQWFNFLSFDDMSVHEVATITDLTEHDARLAKQRNASEPLIWRGSKQQLVMFTKFVQQQKLQLLKGGRFYHLMGHNDKALAIRFFKHHYAQRLQVKPNAIGVVALGDSENDRTMLEAADYPIVIPAMDNNLLSLKNPKAITAKSSGPMGWNQEMLKFIRLFNAGKHLN